MADLDPDPEIDPLRDENSNDPAATFRDFEVDVPSISPRVVEILVRPLRFPELVPIRDEVMSRLEYPIAATSKVLYTISSDLQYLSLAAAQAYVKKYFRNHAQLQLEISATNIFEAATTLESLAQHLAKTLPVSRPKLTLIEITETTTFWTSFRQAQLMQLDRILARHREISSSLLMVGPLKSEDLFLPDQLVWPVKAIPVLVHQLLPAVDAERWMQRLNANPRSIERFSANLKFTWAPNAEKLQEQLEALFGQAAEPSAVINLPDAGKTSNPIDIWLNFLAAKCEDLTLAELDFIVESLFARERLPPEGPPQPPPATEGESSAPPSVPEARTLDAEWRDSADSILYRCGLTFSENVSGGLVLDFAAPTNRAERTAMLKLRWPLLIHRLLQKILGSGVLFGEPIGLENFQHLLRLTCELPLAPQAWWRSLLCGAWERTFGRLPGSQEDASLEALLAVLLLPEASGSRIRQLLPFLLQTLASHAGAKLTHLWKRLVPEFGLRVPVGLLDDLTRHLRLTTGREDLLLLREVLDHGAPPAKLRAAGLAILLMLQGGGDRLDLLNRIHAWLPDSDGAEPLAAYSRSQLFALEFLLVVALQEAIGFPAEELGSRPTGYSLFADVEPGLPAWRDLLELLVKWLLHPRLPEHRRQADWSDQRSQDAHIGTLLYLVERWAQILEGLKSDRSSEESSGIDELMARLKSAFSPRQKTAAENWLLRRVRIYQMEVVSTERHLGRLSPELRARRLKVERLASRFRQAGKQLPSSGPKS